MEEERELEVEEKGEREREGKGEEKKLDCTFLIIVWYNVSLSNSTTHFSLLLSSQHLQTVWLPAEQSE